MLRTLSQTTIDEDREDYEKLYNKTDLRDWKRLEDQDLVEVKLKELLPELSKITTRQAHESQPVN